MKIPTCQKEVTEAWLRDVLSQSLKSSVEVITLSKVNEKDGFLSGILRATILIDDKDKKQVIVKVISDADDSNRSLFNEYNFDELEVNYYEKILPVLIDFEKKVNNGNSELEKLSPKYYAGGFDLEASNRGYFLILEDLIASGHHLVKGKEGLNFDQMKDILVKIARFHALAFAYRDKNPEKVKEWKLPSWYEIFIKDESIKDVYKKSFELFREDLKMEDPDLISPLEKLQSKWLEVYMANVCVKDERFISHGDLWINNAMFDKGNNGKIIDWQLVAHDHPIMDLGLFLCTSLTPENMENWAKDLLSHYANEFMETCQLFKTEPPFDCQEVQEVFFKKGIMLTFLIWLQWYNDVVRPRADFMERLRWQLRECVKQTPDLFQ